MNNKPEKRKYIRDGLSVVMGLLFVGASLFSIWDVFDTIEQAERGIEFIFGGISRTTVITGPLLLLGLKYLIFGHGKPPPRPGEEPEKTPIRNALVAGLIIVSLLASIGLKLWADARMESLGYVTKSIFDS